MTSDRDLLKQALEALNDLLQDTQHADHFCGAIEQCPVVSARNALDALRERLVQPEQWEQFYPDMGKPQPNTIANSEAIPEQISEPVAMRYDFDGYGYRYIDSGSGSNWQTRIKDAEPLYTTPPRREWPKKLWLWRNHVDGRPEYWAFDNPYPLNLDNDDPQTIGEPCGYAIFKESRDGSRGRTEEYVLNQIGLATFPPRREWVGLTDEVDELAREMVKGDKSVNWLARAIEAKLKEKNA